MIRSTLWTILVLSLIGCFPANKENVKPDTNIITISESIEESTMHGLFIDTFEIQIDGKQVDSWAWEEYNWEQELHEGKTTRRRTAGTKIIFFTDSVKNKLELNNVELYHSNYRTMGSSGERSYISFGQESKVDTLELFFERDGKKQIGAVLIRR